MAGFLTGQRFTADALNVLFNKPIGRLVQQSTQSLADNTYTAITFGTGSTVYDSHGFHSESTNTSRITPTIAGYYRFFGTGFFGTESSPVSAVVTFRQNASTFYAGTGRLSGFTIAWSGMAQCDILMNGTTDYVELMMLQDSAGAISTNVSSQFSSAVEWELIRAQ